MIQALGDLLVTNNFQNKEKGKRKGQKLGAR